jgi:hypothetical protein
MKKTVIFLLFSLFLVGHSQMVFAAAETIDGNDPTKMKVSNSATGVKGPGSIPVSVSPNVEMSIWSTLTAYGASAANTLPNNAVGLQYYTRHTASGYAQAPKTQGEGGGPDCAPRRNNNTRHG